MGMTWRFTMPLLSTLAALVIIVHSAEENLDRERRYDLRPRFLDTRPSDNEQPWRIVRSEPIMEQTEQAETWSNDSQDEPPVRRRLGRKRKRRPPAPSSDEVDTDNTFRNPLDSPIPHPESEEVIALDISETSTPGRRRKKIRPNRWTDEPADIPRPLRRRGQRRKRPSLDNWPQLSEFGVYSKDNKPIDADREPLVRIDLDDADVKQPRYSQRGYEDDDAYISKQRPGISQISSSRLQGNQNAEFDKPLVKDDKSLSEFSGEVMGPVEKTNIADDVYDYRELRDKMKEKASKVFYNTDKSKDVGRIDPLTLKDILKRSNGTSLSEILQQHNLTLADLLNGKENAISVLKSEKSLQKAGKPVFDNNNLTLKDKNELKPEITALEDVTTKTSPEDLEKEFITTISPNKYTYNDNILITLSPDLEEKPEIAPEIKVRDDSYLGEPSDTNLNKKIKVYSTTTPKIEQRTSGMLAIRHYPGAIRRKLRMRPMMNNTYKSQLSRDLIALSARRYVHHNRRNNTKAKEWREMAPLMKNINTTENKIEREEKSLVTTTSIPDETTTVMDQDESTESTIADESATISNIEKFIENKTLPAEIETTTISVEILATEMDTSVTEKTIAMRPAVNSPGRRQPINNRLKRKRMKHKLSTTEAPREDVTKSHLGLGSSVSSSELIARTQLPKATSPDDYTETVTELEEFLTTRSISKSSIRSTRFPSTKSADKRTTVTRSPLQFSSTEETAKIEIEEILNDTRSSAKLSKILRERNMTLSELLEHRERGSSHVHLADIFHNASREPNPPEPFLSKSSIEPISKETYPLRALLDANSHDPPAKVTTTDPLFSTVNIPVIMDFGNNVNENAENMGIMSLFNNFTKNVAKVDEEKTTLQQDSKGIPYTSTIITVNATDNDETRESRMLADDQDMISWNEIFSMIRKNQKNETQPLDTLTKEITPTETYKKITLEEDVDGDGLIVLEDLQHLRDLDNSIASGSEEKIEFRTLERTELEPGILNNTPNSAKSVTVATASIVGLAMILFLLTYAALKWRQQRTMTHKKTFCDERIPSPVFENRKVKKNCSSRSISPMLPTSNIYTMNTLDSQNGKDSPEYMWDSLRKPFQ